MLRFKKTKQTPKARYLYYDCGPVGSNDNLGRMISLLGEYGLRNKREVWRVKFTLAKIRKAARELLTLDEKEPKRLFEGIYPVCVKSHLNA